VCYVLGFYVSADSFFLILRSWKARVHIAAFRPTRHVLKIFRYLEVRNRVRNWNKEKNVIFVVWKLQLCQLEIPIFIYKIMSEYNNKNSVSFLFCEFIHVTSWNDGKTVNLVRLSFKFPNRNTGFIIKVNQCQCKHVYS